MEGSEGGDVDIVGRPKEEFMGDGQAERGLAQFAVGEEEDGLLVHLRWWWVEDGGSEDGNDGREKKTKN